MSTTKELADIAREFEGQAKSVTKIAFFREAATALDRLHAYETAGGDGEIAEIEAWLTKFRTLECKAPQTQFEHAVGQLYRNASTLLLALKKSRAFHAEIAANRDRLNGIARAAEFLAERACAIAEERTAIMWGLLCVAGNLKAALASSL
jgi:hypothetical protein